MQPKFMPIMFILSLVVACSQSGKLQMSVEGFRGTDWVLEEIDGSAAVDRVQSTIRFQGNDRIAGWGGCNRYFANVRSGRNFFKVGPIGSTRRICPPVVMDQEERFFNALQKSRSIRMEGHQLVIDSEATQKPLKFGRLKKSGS
ncbi:MAG: META domain-containing protein [Desulfobacterales bacterium]|jgi:heat shock protein HslJ